MNLGSLAKQILTASAIRMAFALLGRLASKAELARYVGEQNLDPKTADRYSRLFAAEHGLKYAVEYDDQPGSENRTYLKERSVLRGPSAAEAKRRIADGKSSSALSLDEPAIRLHELGHVKDLAHRKAYRMAAVLAPNVAAVASGILGQRGHPWLSALTAMLGRVPLLVQEWEASRYAKAFLEKHLPPDEAQRVRELLNAGFRGYLYQTGAVGAATAVWQHLRPGLQERWDRK